PYIVLAALLDGEVTPATFLPHRIQDPHLRHLLARETTLVENPAFTHAYPQGIPNRITLRTTDGAVYQREVTYPRGHARNRMSDEEVVEKFRRNTALLPSSQVDQLIERLFHLEKEEECGALSTLLIPPGEEQEG
ncbi:MAG: MmgE/PrpD family protein, partial [Nitrospinota bacterium]